LPENATLGDQLLWSIWMIEAYAECAAGKAKLIQWATGG